MEEENYGINVPEHISTIISSGVIHVQKNYKKASRGGEFELKLLVWTIGVTQCQQSGDIKLLEGFKSIYANFKEDAEKYGMNGSMVERAEFIGARVTYYMNEYERVLLRSEEEIYLPAGIYHAIYEAPLSGSVELSQDLFEVMKLDSILASTSHRIAEGLATLRKALN